MSDEVQKLSPREIAKRIVADARSRLVALKPEYDSVDLGESLIAAALERVKTHLAAATEASEQFERAHFSEQAQSLAWQRRSEQFEENERRALARNDDLWVQVEALRKAAVRVRARCQGMRFDADASAALSDLEAALSVPVEGKDLASRDHAPSLRAALEPFAKIYSGDNHESCQFVWDTDKDHWTAPNHMWGDSVTAGMIKAAHVAFHANAKAEESVKLSFSAEAKRAALSLCDPEASSTVESSTQPWISVNDGLPGEQGQDSDDVLVFLNGHCKITDHEARDGGGWGQRIGFYDARKGMFRVAGQPDRFVTHWMPSPAPPTPAEARSEQAEGGQ